MKSINRKFEAFLDDFELITLLLPHDYHEGNAKSFSLYMQNEFKTDLPIIKKSSLDEFVKYECNLPAEVEIGQRYKIYNEYEDYTDLQIGAIIRNRKFDEMFFYDEDDLGVIYSKAATKFKLWAPTALEVKLMILKQDSVEATEIEMNRSEKGTWSIEVQGDLEGMHYYYRLCVNQKWREAVDPYAASLSINGERGVIVDLESTRSDFPELPPFRAATDAIIYEAHVRDFTIHPNSGVEYKGLYLGMTEENTAGKYGNTTGLSYIKDLGITHLELLPLNDFFGVDEKNVTKEYNWGYNPLHFNAPDGSYSTNPKDPYSRIRELKAMIEAIQRQGIHVILDVVYNHVYERETSDFENIVPGYYFRHDEHGMPSNGTGVGNDIASERLMVRKFIVDSVKFWMKEYNINGFRFDLMGILDVETMREVRAAVDSIDDSAIILGEGWDLNTPLPADKKATIRNAGKLAGIAQFNDWFRDTIKGSTFNLYDRGYILGNENKNLAVRQLIAGSAGYGHEAEGLFVSPEQTVNYIESHDNHTLWDKIAIVQKEESEQIKMLRHRLGTAIVLLSQGIPFLHSGQEFFRSKQGVENSYQSSDSINRIDWDRQHECREAVEWVKGLIRIRQHHGAFRFSERDLIDKHLRFIKQENSSVVFALKDVGAYGPWENIAVVLHHLEESAEITLPNENPWDVLCDGESADTEPLSTVTEGKLKVDPFQVFVLVQ